MDTSAHVQQAFNSSLTGKAVIMVRTIHCCICCIKIGVDIKNGVANEISFLGDGVKRDSHAERSGMLVISLML